MDMKENLIEVRRNVFISKNDPDFLRKYLTFHPNDPNMLYEYALEWKRKKNYDKYYEYLEKSAANGSLQAKMHLREGVKNQQPETFIPAKKEDKTEKIAKGLLLFAIFLLLLLIGGLLFHFFTNYFHFHHVENHYYESTERNFYHSSSEDGTGSTNINKKERLVSMVVSNAIVRFKETNGSFPKSLIELNQDYPNNWLSSLPSLSYKKGISRFSLLKNGKPLPKETPLSLHFYPETNELSLKSGDETLVVYPVASGKEKLPFSKSKVTLRVMNPNGGNGSLGTRGLVLHDNYAIHGTNEPEKIGSYISKGCIRMKNKDIENLYPYVSLGTPFFVEGGGAGEPTFGDSLPFISDITPKDNPGESDPDTIFDWKS